MKKFNIKVNGKTYEVEVEDLGVSAPSAPSVHTEAPKPTPAPVSAPPKEVAKPSKPLAEGETVTAPMPGKILKIVKGEGTSVKCGDVVLILEAMKMENEITAAVDGSIKQVAVAEGDTVNPGDTLFVIG